MLIFNGPGLCEVHGISSSGEGPLLKSLTAVKKIAEADQTIVYDGQVDLFNRADLIKKACKMCNGHVNTVVFQGFDHHYTFVQDPSLDELRIIDVYDTAPPEPPKLAYNLQRMEEIGMFGDMMLAFEYHITDLKQYEDPARTTIFPCHVPGLTAEFMNCLKAEPQGDIKLVGCEATKKAFEERFPSKQYEHVNICPLTSVRPARPFILRCCQSDNLGLKEINGVKGVAVHWGANPREICDAIKLLAAGLKR